MLPHNSVQGTVSHATMITEDIFESMELFMSDTSTITILPDHITDKWEEIVRDFYSIENEYLREHPDTIEEYNPDPSEIERRFSILNDDAWDLFNEIAPKGFYFGAHTGNGSDFGFWIIDDDYYWRQICEDIKQTVDRVPLCYDVCICLLEIDKQLETIREEKTRVERLIMESNKAQ